MTIEEILSKAKTDFEKNPNMSTFLTNLKEKQLVDTEAPKKEELKLETPVLPKPLQHFKDITKQKIDIIKNTKEVLQDVYNVLNEEQRASLLEKEKIKVLFNQYDIK